MCKQGAHIQCVEGTYPEGLTDKPVLTSSQHLDCGFCTGCRVILLIKGQTPTGLAHMQALVARSFGLLKQPLLQVRTLDFIYYPSV